MDNYFEGWYFKHQKDGTTLSLIPGRSRDDAFIQVITNDGSFDIKYPLGEYTKDDIVQIGNSKFKRDGIELDIHTDTLNLRGKLDYSDITPLKYDIMGPFRFLKMECRHIIISMNHLVFGSLNLNGRELDFTNGKGYIEGDSGTSFPDNYAWVQCNAFCVDCSVMLSIAKIPFAGLKFNGSICVVWYGKKEYRLATYKGAKIVCNSPKRLELSQGEYRIIIEILDHSGHTLNAPNNGIMCRTIYESPSCRARFRFYSGDEILFDMESNYTSYEYVE